MKNFLKSFAIFACSALLLGACTEEDTEDVGGVVMSPTITEIQGGNEKAVVSWTVPTGNSDVNSCQIKWLGATTGVSGSYNYTVEEGGEYTFTIEPKYSTDGTLPADTYGLTLQTSVTTSGESSTLVVSTVVVYDESTYEDSMPTPEVTAVSGGVQIEWSDVDADCAYVDVLYYDSYNMETSATTEALEEGSTTLLSNAKQGKTVTYTVYFKPEGGYDYVSLTSTVDIPSAIDGATAGEIQAGKSRMIGSYTMPSDVDAVKSVILVYGDTEVDITPEDINADAVETFEITDVAAGTYDVKIYCVDTDGFPSVEDDFADLVTVYDDATYADALPQIKSVTNIEGEVTVTLYKLHDDCKYVYVYYKHAGGTKSKVLTADQIAADIREVTISGAEALEGSDIDIEAQYMPDYSIGDKDDLVVVDGEDELTVPYISPAQPTDLEVTELAYDVATDVSTLKVKWNYTSDIYVDKAYVYYTDTDYVEVDPSTTEYTFSTEQGIKIDEPTSIFVVAVNEHESVDDTYSAASDSATATAYGATTYSAANLPTPVIVTEENGDITVTWVETADLQAVTVSYEGMEYPATQQPDNSFEATFPYTNGSDTFAYTAEFLPTAPSKATYTYSGNVEVTIDACGIVVTDLTPATPTNVAVQAAVSGAGTSEIYVSWTISSIEYTTKSIVYVVDENGAQVAEIPMAAAATLGTNSYTITTADYIEADETYTVYVKATNAFGYYSEPSVSSDEVTTYDNASYTAPAAVITFVEGVATISWNLDEEDETGSASIADLNAMSLEYEVGGTSTPATLDVTDLSGFGIVADYALPNVDASSTVTYTATFCPDGGATDVEVEGTATVPYVATAYDLVLAPYYDAAADESSIIATWTQSAETSVTAKVVYKVKGEGDETEEVETATSALSGEYEIKDLDVETYEVYVELTTNDNGTETTIATAPVEVTTYGESTYSTDDLPAIAATANDRNDGLVITWDDYTGTDLTGITVHITEGDEEVDMTDFASDDHKTSIGDTNDPTYTYTAYFMPTDAAEDSDPVAVEYAGEAVAIPSVQPLDPTGVSAQVGYTEANGSYVTLTWTLPTDSYRTAVWVMNGDVVTQTLEADVVTTTIKNLTADTDYTFDVYTVNVDAKCETPYTANVTTYGADTYNYLLPTVVATKKDGLISFVWSDIDTDLQSVQVTYAGTQQAAVDVSSGAITMSAITANDSYTTFSYVATFKPTDALDAVTEEVTDVTILSDYVIAADGTYEIYTADGLVYFADVVNGTNNYGGTAPTQNTSANGKLMANIDLSTVCSEKLGTNWVQIGTYTSIAYAGKFDGNDKIISNMYINNADADANGHSLFCYVNGGTISNLTVEDAYVSVNKQMAAGIAGRIDGTSVVDNCKVVGGYFEGTSYCGGVVAYVNGASATVSNCSIASSVVSVSGAHVGGISGNANGLFLNCTTSSDVTVTGVGTNSSTGTGVGGIVGVYGGVSIINCVNGATVKNTAYSAAGIIGAITSASDLYIIGCGNTGDISATSGNVGGMVGRANNSINRYIVGCYNTGAITGNLQAGGLVGTGTNAIYVIGCYATGEVDDSDEEFTNSNHGVLVGLSNASMIMNNCFYKPGTNVSWACSTSGTSVDETVVSITGAPSTDNISSLNTAITSAVKTYSLPYTCSFADDGTIASVAVVTAE